MKKVCLECKKDFETTNKYRKFCSRTCYYKNPNAHNLRKQLTQGYWDVKKGLKTLNKYTIKYQLTWLKNYGNKSYFKKYGKELKNNNIIHQVCSQCERDGFNKAFWFCGECQMIKLLVATIAKKHIKESGYNFGQLDRLLTNMSDQDIAEKTGQIKTLGMVREANMEQNIEF